MVKNTFSQRLRGSIQTSLPQDAISIFLSDQRLQYVVADHLGQAHMLREYVDEAAASPIELLKSIFSEDAVLRMTYGQSHLILMNSVSLLEPMNQTEDWDNISQFLLPKPKGVIHLNDYIDDSRIKIKYPFSESANLTAHQMFTNLSICHSHTLLIQLFGGISTSSDTLLFAYILNGVISLFLFKDSKLQYGNQFDVLSEEDKVYYIMLIYDQFDLDPSTLHLYVAIGDELSSGVISALRSYVKNIDILEFRPRAERSKPILVDKSIYTRYYFPLSSTNLLGKLKSC